MGVGGNIIDNKISCLLLAFSKIKELANILDSKKEGKLSSILFSIIQDKNELNSNVQDFKMLSSKEKLGNNTKKILKFMLETLHKELKNNEEPSNIDNNLKNEYYLYEKLMEDFNSVIQKLFFGVEKKTFKCKECHNEDIRYQIIYKKTFLMPEKEKEIVLKTFLDNMENKKKKIKKCKHCQKEVNFETSSKIIDLPEIFIIHFDKKNNPYCKLDYYTKIKIKDATYKLISFFQEKNENPNVYYKEKGKWFRYEIEQKRKKEIKDDITTELVNPSIIFLKKKKTQFKNFFNRISNLLQDKENIIEMANEHILPEIHSENYYLLNIFWYNKILKIYESEEKYQNDEYIIDSIKKVKDINKLNIYDKIEIYENFKRRKKDIENENFFKIEKPNNLYPINFIPIKENIFNSLLKELKISTDKYQKYLYKIKFGENYAFIRDKNKNESGETIFVCYINENKFEIVSILKYNHTDEFNNEIKNYISNRGGLEYYYQSRRLKINSKDNQIIINSDNKKIGSLLNLKDLNNYMNIYKFNENMRKEIGVSTDTIIKDKVSIFDEINFSIQN